MPYGVMREQTRLYLRKRVELDNLIDKLERDFLETLDGNEPDEWSSDEKIFCVSVIYDGALDEEFFIQTMYAVNVADWIAEQCAADYESSLLIASDPRTLNGWSVTVYEADASYNTGETVYYRVTNDTFTATPWTQG